MRIDRLRVIVLGLVLGGCAHGGTLTAGRFSKPGLSYRVGEPPEPWRRVHIEDNDLAWVQDESDATLQINSRCGKDYDVPLLALTHHLLIGFTAVQVMQQSTLPLAGREALRTHASAKLDGVRRELELVVLKKDGCVYDFSLSASPGDSFHRHQPALQTVLSGFAAPAS